MKATKAKDNCFDLGCVICRLLRMQRWMMSCKTLLGLHRWVTDKSTSKLFPFYRNIQNNSNASQTSFTKKPILHISIAMQNFLVAEGLNAYKLSNGNWRSDSSRKVNREIWISKKITAAAVCIHWWLRRVGNRFFCLLLLGYVDEVTSQFSKNLF